MMNSCGSGNHTKHEIALGKALKEKYGAQLVTIRENKTDSVLEITVHMGKELENSGDIRLIGSNAVQLLYDELDEEEKKSISLLRVGVETPTSKSDIMEYHTSDLKETASLLKLDNHVFDLLKKRDYTNIKSLVWPQEILPKVDDLFGVYEKMCERDGEITKIELLGFNYVVKTDSRSGAKVPVFVAWFAVNHGNVKNEYQLSIRRDTKQVITLSIN